MNRRPNPSTALPGRTSARPRRRSRLRWAAIVACWTGWEAFAYGAEGPAPTTTRSSEAPVAGARRDETLEDIDLLQLEVPTVVTPARRQQPVATLSYAVSVITAEDIRRAGARSVPDALRLAPGVDVAELAYGNTALQPRGLHGLLSRETLVLVDGRQIFDSVFGGTIWSNWPFQLEDIERIEVVRGPGGVTWGANAVNGVINIITKDPADQAGLTITGGGGSRGTHKEHAGYAFADEKLRLRVSGEYESSDGFKRGGSAFQRLDDDYKSGRMAVHSLFQLTPKDTLTLSGGSAVQDEGFQAAPITRVGVDETRNAQVNYLLGKWEHQIADGNVFQWTGYVNDFYTAGAIETSEYRYQQLALQFSHVFKPSEAHTITWGVDGRADLVDATNADPFMLRKDFVSTGIVGLYLQDEWRFAPRWTLNVGGRIDYEFYGGFQPSARAALSYELTPTSYVYGAVSRAFQMSPAAERFVDVPVLGGLVRYWGNRDIDATSLIAYEVGYRGRFFDRLDASLCFYWHDYDNFIENLPRLGPPGVLRVVPFDSASPALYGTELEASYAITKQLKLLGHYTFEEMNWNGRAGFDAEDAISPPANKFMLGVRYDATKDLHLTSYLYFVDSVRAQDAARPWKRREVDSYLRWDLRAEYDFWKDRASVAVGVRNLLDPHHYEGGTQFLNNAEVPRTVYAEMRITFK